MATLTDHGTAKIFMSGRSQAVRLPKALRFNVAEVHIRRVGDGLLLTPVKRDWHRRVEAAFGALETLPAMERPADWGQAERQYLWS